MIIRSNLRKLAESRDISIRKIAQDIDYRFESVRMMYIDEMERYPRDLLTKLCVYFDVSVSELLTLTDELAPQLPPPQIRNSSGHATARRFRCY